MFWWAILLDSTAKKKSKLHQNNNRFLEVVIKKEEKLKQPKTSSVSSKKCVKKLRSFVGSASMKWMPNASSGADVNAHTDIRQVHLSSWEFSACFLQSTASQPQKLSNQSVNQSINWAEKSVEDNKMSPKRSMRWQVRQWGKKISQPKINWLIACQVKPIKWSVYCYSS